MVTIVNNPGPVERVVEVDRGDGGAGWAIAVLVLLAVIGGLFVWYRYYRVEPSQNPTTNINVTLPTTNTGTPGGTTP
jgi:ABC-type transporter Mla subunit MlaD